MNTFENMSALCAIATNATLDDSPLPCTTVYYHDGAASSMLIPPRSKRGRCGDGCFTSPRCGTGRKQTCKRCPYPASCRNRTLDELLSDQSAIRRKLTARVWQPQRVASCAIVGSAATMLGHLRGAEIDAHDVVIRVNTAPTRGFEAHVGQVRVIPKYVHMRNHHGSHAADCDARRLLSYRSPCGRGPMCVCGGQRHHRASWMSSQRSSRPSARTARTPCATTPASSAARRCCATVDPICGSLAAGRPSGRISMPTRDSIRRLGSWRARSSIPTARAAVG